MDETNEQLHPQQAALSPSQTLGAGAGQGGLSTTSRLEGLALSGAQHLGSFLPGVPAAPRAQDTRQPGFEKPREAQVSFSPPGLWTPGL